MAVPVFLHEVEEIVVVNHSKDRYAVEYETPSLIQTAEDCCIEELPGTDSSVVGGHKLRKAMLRLISTSTKENNFEMGGWKKNTGFRKFLNLFQRKKSKNQKETSSPNNEKKIQNEKHLKNFHKPFMKCLKVRKSEKKSKKLSMETDSEVKVDPHEMKENYCFSVTPAAIDDESCNDILNNHQSPGLCLKVTALETSIYWVIHYPC
ncbi:uncharacterized protein LOC132563626 [Ylistrum balloti]|uniref:uncharacterized protein LOC132563626 n=1 Tax=Ylistrum balloti TaxID=509963 RepID=UPI002905D607|nr:uncharacterized protein LOC132563626 [Ylistrum balloti]